MRLKSILNSGIGNILEWYDFGLFTLYSGLFSQLFFPAHQTGAALVSTLTIFAVGFICRPIGAIIFGYMGDTVGRVKTLRFSILMISLPTLLIGLIPTYATIGIFAPILLMLIRIWQGISIGGEYSGNIIYLAESVPASSRAFFTSFASTGANLGILLATIAGSLSHLFFSEAIFNTWGWRIPYLLSGILSLMIYYSRLKMRETAVFEQLQRENLLAANPLSWMFKHDLMQVLRTLSYVCMGTTFYYFSFVYIPLYLSENHVSFAQISSLMTCLFALMIIFVPIAGKICDAVGRRKMMLFNAALIALIVVPGFYAIEHCNYVSVISVLILFVIASSLEQGTTSVVLVENFKPPARYLGLSFGYNLGNGILGGTVPLVSALLLKATGLSVMPAVYIAGCAMITGMVAWFFVKDSAEVSLM